MEQRFSWLLLCTYIAIYNKLSIMNTMFEKAEVFKHTYMAASQDYMLAL